MVFRFAFSDNAHLHRDLLLSISNEERERERERVASIVIWRPTWLKLVSIFVRARVRRNQTLYALNSKLIGGGKDFEMEKRDS